MLRAFQGHAYWTLTFYCKIKMEFFSSLKNAYDSIGSEISKTFDSSDFEKDPKKNKAKIDPTLEDTSTATEHGKVAICTWVVFSYI